MRLSLRPEVRRLAWPVLVEESLLVLMALLTTWLASRLGKESVAAVGMVEALCMVFHAGLMALATGGTVAVAHCWGRAHKGQAGQAALQALLAAATLGLLIALLLVLGGSWLLDGFYHAASPASLRLAEAYLHVQGSGLPLLAVVLVAGGALRGAGYTAPTMRLNLLMHGLGLVFSLPLMFGLGAWSGMGIVGAAWGQLLGRAVAACLALRLLYRGHDGFALPRWRHWQLQPALLRAVLRVALPTGAEALVFHAGKLLTQVMVAGYGTAAIAASTIAAAIVTLMNIPGHALAVALTTLVGHNGGRGDWTEAEKLIREVYRAALIGLSVLGLLSLPLAYPLARLYTNEAEVQRLTAQIVQLNGLFMPVWAASFVLPAALRGVGDAGYTLKVAALGMWLVRVVLGWLLGVWLAVGVIGVWFAMYLDWVLRGWLFWRRLRSGRWQMARVLDEPPNGAAAAPGVERPSHEERKK